MKKTKIIIISITSVAIIANVILLATGIVMIRSKKINRKI